MGWSGGTGAWVIAVIANICATLKVLCFFLHATFVHCEHVCASVTHHTMHVLRTLQAYTVWGVAIVGGGGCLLFNLYVYVLVMQVEVCNRSLF